MISPNNKKVFFIAEANSNQSLQSKNNNVGIDGLTKKSSELKGMEKIKIKPAKSFQRLFNSKYQIFKS